MRCSHAFGARWLLLTLLPLPACVGYTRLQRDEPLAAAQLEQLIEGESTLTQCLHLLGAPNEVLEHRGNGMALVWSWQDVDDWSLDVSVPLGQDLNLSFDLDLTAADRPGAVLWFGPDLVLEHWRQGLLGELLLRRVRPAVADDSGG